MSLFTTRTKLPIRPIGMYQLSRWSNRATSGLHANPYKLNVLVRTGCTSWANRNVAIHSNLTPQQRLTQKLRLEIKKPEIAHD